MFYSGFDADAVCQVVICVGDSTLNVCVESLDHIYHLYLLLIYYHSTIRCDMLRWDDTDFC